MRFPPALVLAVWGKKIRLSWDVSHVCRRRAARLLGIPFERFNGITAHLGNGCSLAKIQAGHSVDTSMGFTPLEGVVMGTRSGDIDPALIGHVAEQRVREEGLSPGEAYASILEILNKESGLKALAGTNMMQEIRARAQRGDPEAVLAIEIYAYRIAGYIENTGPLCRRPMRLSSRRA